MDSPTPPNSPDADPATKKPRYSKSRKYRRRKRLVKWAQPSVHDAWWFLKPREREFVTNCLSGMTYQDAYAKAGYGKGNNAFQLMSRPLIRAAIYQKTMEAYREANIEESQFLREVATMAFMPSDMLAGPPTWENKIKALEMLGRYQKWLVTNVNVRASGSIAHLFGAATQAVMKEAVATSAHIHRALEHSEEGELVTRMASTVLEHAPAEGKS